MSFNVPAVVPSSDDEKKYQVYKSLEHFERNLPESVTILRTDHGSKVFLAETVHASEKSQDDVSLLMRNVRPDIVVVELCPARLAILQYDERKTKDTRHFSKVIASIGSVPNLFRILLSKGYAKVVHDLGIITPSGEVRRAVWEAQRLQNCIVNLGDRHIGVSLQRAINRLSLIEMLKFIWKFMLATSKKKKDLEVVKLWTDEFPELVNVLINERHLYLCHSLQVAALPCGGRPARVVGIVGIGHVKCITENWGKVKQCQINDILQIPPDIE